MTISEKLKALMDSARKIQVRSDKLSVNDLQLMLGAISSLKFGQEQWGSNSGYIRDTGIYYCHEGVTDKPSEHDGYLIVISPGNKGWNNGTTVQFYIDNVTHTFYQRSMNSSYVWTEWKQVGGGK